MNNLGVTAILLGILIANLVGCADSPKTGSVSPTVATVVQLPTATKIVEKARPTITLSADGTLGIFKLNSDYKRRDQLLGLVVEWGVTDIGGTVQVDQIPLSLLETLFAEKFIAPEDKQNEAPTAQQFLEFMRKYPSVIAFGYVVSPAREDYRTTIDGIFVWPRDVTPELREAFIKFSKNADELDTDNGLGSWWD